MSKFRQISFDGISQYGNVKISSRPAKNDILWLIIRLERFTGPDIWPKKGSGLGDSNHEYVIADVVHLAKAALVGLVLSYFYVLNFKSLCHNQMYQKANCFL